MRSIDMESAKLYVKAGYFPRVYDTVAITDLQDAFGHLPWNFILHLAASDDTRDNACTLFELLWGREEAGRISEKGWEIHQARAALVAAETEVAKLSKQLKCTSIYLDTK